MWIEQEQNRSGARLRDTGERQSAGQGTAGFRRHGMTVFDQRPDEHEGIPVAGFEHAGESDADIRRERTALVLIERVLRRCGGKLRRCRDFRLVQCPSHQGEHARIDVSRFGARGDFGLKICNQLCGVRIAPIGAIPQVLEQLLQDKQITDCKRLILAGRRHVASSAREGGKNLSRGALAVSIEVGAERRRPALGNSDRDPSRILVRRRGLWLGSAHRASSANHPILTGSRVSVLPKPGEIPCTDTRPWLSIKRSAST